MSRQLITAIGLVALAVAFGPLARAALAQPHAESHPPEAKAKAEGAAGAGASQEGAHAEGAHAEGAHAAEAQPNILEPQPSLAIWTVVVFLGLLFVLGKFAWKPLLDALHKREEHLEHVLHETERARNEAERLLAEHRRQVAEAEDRARALFEQARIQAQATAEEMIQKARAEAETEKNRARQEIGSARDQALSEIWSRTADLAVNVASRVLTKNLGPDEHRRLVETAMQELPAAGNGHGGRTA